MFDKAQCDLFGAFVEAEHKFLAASNAAIFAGFGWLRSERHTGLTYVYLPVYVPVETMIEALSDSNFALVVGELPGGRADV